MKDRKQFFREIPPLSGDDSFLVFDRVKDEFDFPVHFHPEYELNFIKNAKGAKRIVGDHIEEIDDIELVFVGPNLYHAWETYNCKRNDIHEITIQFDDKLFDGSLLSRRIMQPIREMFNRSLHGVLYSKKTAEDLSDRICNISRLDGMDYFIEILSILYDLSISRNQRILSTYTVDAEKFEIDDKMQVVYDYIQKNYSEKITLEEISEVALMSPVSFSRFIKKRTNKTFVNYVNDIRIGYAARSLVEKDLSISEIAFRSGFNNIANFNRIFKSVKGVTPTKYREEFNGIKRIL